MKIYFSLVVLLALTDLATGQSMPAINDPVGLIRQVLASQKQLQQMSYSMRRSDTLVTGDTRVMAGPVYYEPELTDTVFGFRFQARKDGVAEEVVYDGHSGYLANDTAKSYAIITSPSRLPELLLRSGGQLVCADFVKLDTAKANRVTLLDRDGRLQLLFEYADLPEHDVIRRIKTVTIDRNTLLPVAVRRRQETLGKVQDLFYEATDRRVNDQASRYNFLAPPFLSTYVHQVPAPGKKLAGLLGMQAPGFELSTFAGNKINMAGLAGSVVLLDFWELWCGPCIQSMPKVQALYQRFHAKGLQVFGIVNDLKQLETARLYVQKKPLTFPMLVGDAALVKNYQLSAIPLYVLIDRSGKIVFVSEGFSDKLEQLINALTATNG